MCVHVCGALSIPWLLWHPWFLILPMLLNHEGSCGIGQRQELHPVLSVGSSYQGCSLSTGVALAWGKTSPRRRLARGRIEGWPLRGPSTVPETICQHFSFPTKDLWGEGRGSLPHWEALPCPPCRNTWGPGEFICYCIIFPCRSDSS